MSMENRGIDEAAAASLDQPPPPYEALQHCLTDSEGICVAGGNVVFVSLYRNTDNVPR